MSEPAISHYEAIHLTATSGASLSDATKLDETSKVSISAASTNTKRMNLNSDGHTKVGSTWLEESGSLDFKVVRDSTVQALIVAGATAFLTIIINDAAGAMEVKGYRYEVVFGSTENSWEAGGYVGGTASFDVNGARSTIMGS